MKREITYLVHKSTSYCKYCGRILRISNKSGWCSNCASIPLKEAVEKGRAVIK